MVLFKKDLTISVKSILLFLAIEFLLGQMGYSMDSNIVAQSLYISIVILTTIGTLNVIAVQDEKHSTDMLFNSLSLERKTIVRSKYLSMGVLPFLYGIALFTMTRAYHLSGSMMLHFSPKTIFSLEMFIFSIGLSFIFLSIYLPMYYLSMEKAGTIGQIGMAIVFFIPVIIIKYIDKIGDISIMTGNIISYMLFLGISLILYLISLQISIRIYKKREF